MARPPERAGGAADGRLHAARGAAAPAAGMTAARERWRQVCRRCGLWPVPPMEVHEMTAGSNAGVVAAVSLSPRHTFSKLRVDSIQLLAGLGVEGDAHMGTTVK